MAGAFKWMNRADASGPLVGTTGRGIYTVPTASTALVKEIIAYAFQTTNLTIYAVKAGGTTGEYPIVAEALESGETKIYSLQMVLEAGDTLVAAAGAASAVSVHVSGLEVS